MLEKACAVFHPISKKYDPAHANLYSERTHFAEGTMPLLGAEQGLRHSIIISVRPFQCRQSLGPVPESEQT